ncbi:hypothetical protein LCGC14_0220930 [marine sediment metagenome]|uniref:Uncharacterized protein n=1 Tax=marine sediment metagenome TaxID=412755 RepID=A0A0F9UDF8_9ZZZZ
MNKQQIAAKLRAILCQADSMSGLLSRKRSSKHADDIEVLLEHISLLVADLRFDNAATRNELWQVRDILEE